jgi:type VI secretion system protein ImpC
VNEQQQQQERQPSLGSPSEDTFSELLQKSFRPNSADKSQAIERAVETLAEWALRNTELLSDDTRTSIKALIAQLDDMISTQLNEVLHAPEVQQLEGAWRGLHFLVNKTESDEMLKIKLMPISKRELRSTLRRYKGSAWDQSPLFKKIYEEEYGVLGGHPYGCLVGDFTFDHSPPDCETLGELAKISAAAHTPFITAAAPTVMGLDSWLELSNPRDLGAVFSTPEYAAWNSLRRSDDARYLGLTLPRFLARLPYGAKSDPVTEFDFEEDTGGGDPSRFVWANSAYAMASNITRAFKLYGWCTQIRGVESGGAVEGLPTYVFPTSDGSVDMSCPTEIAISDRRENELAKAGFIPLIHRKNTDIAAFIGAQSLHKPAVYDDPAATANVELSARLPYLFASCRFAHYLKAMVRDKIGSSFSSAAEVQDWLQSWISGNYVHANPELASEYEKARQPLADAEVIVTENPENPGYFNAQFLLKPHYQLEGLTVSLRLVSKLKSDNS